MPRHYVRKKDNKVSIYEPPRATTIKEKKGGRPSLYTEQLQNHAYTLAKIGLNNEQIALELGIPKATFHGWVKKFPEFSDELNKNRNNMLQNSVKCLGLRIEGYSYKEKLTEVKELEFVDPITGKKVLANEAVEVKDPITGKKKKVNGGIIVREVKRKIIEHHYPPDTKAAMYVLDKRSKHFRRQPEAIDEQVNNETFNVIVKEIKPPKEKNKK